MAGSFDASFDDSFDVDEVLAPVVGATSGGGSFGVGPVHSPWPKAPEPQKRRKRDPAEYRRLLDRDLALAAEIDADDEEFVLLLAMLLDE